MAQYQDPSMRDGVQGPCPFSEFGCSETQVFFRSEMDRHLQENIVLHFSILLKMALNLSRDVESFMYRTPGLVSRNPSFVADYENVISDILTRVQGVVGEHRELREAVRKQSERIKTLERRMATMRVSAGSSAPRSTESGDPGLPTNELAHRVTNLENQTADHAVLLVENNQNVDDTRQQMNSLEQQLEAAQETIRRLVKKMESHEHLLAIPKYLQNFVRFQQIANHDGVLLWKINHFSFKMQDAVTGAQKFFYSPCFYTSSRGYMVCARIYLNGDGIGKGTHISVFFVVMRGQFDEQLHWPFRQKVTIMLLDQDNVEHVIDAFTPDPDSSSTRREITIAGGCPLFCPLAKLNKHAYVRDDVMYIKVIVDKADFI